MKKIYLGLFSFALVGAASAQTMNVKTRDIRKNHTVQEAPAKTSVGVEKGLTLWTNDFSNAAQWAFADNSATLSGDNWIIGTTAPAGSFPIAAIASTTAANNFALFDSDLLCSNDQNADVKIVTPIDLSASASVSIQFQSFYRNFQGDCYVIASTDGVTWTQFPVHTDVAANGSTANPANVQVNLSSVIGGSSTAYIGFRYIGGCDYAWMVDDVKIVETDNYDLALQNFFWGTTATWGARLPYYQIPVAQIQPIEFSGIVNNLGALTQTDVVAAVTIPSASYSSMSAPSTVAPNMIDTIDVAATFTPAAAVATFATSGGVTSGATDANTADNTKTLSFATTNFIYARDAGTITSGSFNQGNGYELGNIFDISANASLKAIDVTVASTSVVGTEIYGIVYGFDANGDFLYIENTVSRVLTAADLGANITLVLNNPVSVNAGESYLAAVGSFGSGGVGNDLVVGVSGVSEAQTTFLLDGNEGQGTWFFSTNTPMVRMNFNPTLGVNEISNEYGVSVYPNPATDNATVSFELTNSSDVVITVTDLAGKVVFTSVMNNASAGTHQADINTVDMAGGVYTVNFKANNSIVSKKLVVKK